MSASFFALSLHDWLKQHPGATERDWRYHSAAKYAAMRASAHWHNGVPCATSPACPTPKTRPAPQQQKEV